MYYWDPKRIKELKAAGYKLHASPASLVKKSDQAISKEPATAGNQRSPGPGHKLDVPAPAGPSVKPQAASVKRQAVQDESSKPQAPSSKRQASSHKLQDS